MVFEKENSVYIALDLLIERAKVIQDSVSERYKVDNKKSFLNEFCTVKVCTARRSGHSYAIAQYAVEKMSKGEDVIVLVLKTDQEKLYRNLILSLAKNKKVNLVKLTNREFIANHGSIILSSRGDGEFDHLRGISSDYLLVDVASMWSKKDVKNIYRVCGECMIYKKNPIVAFLE